jgi:hypothetical protein
MQKGWIYVYVVIWYESHMKCHDTSCTQFSLCIAMETRCYTVRDVITAVRWVETTLVTPGCIWKRKPIPKSHMKHSVFLKLQLPWCCAESCHLLSFSPNALLCNWVSECWDCVTSYEVMRWEVTRNYWRLLILIFVFAIYKSALFCLVDFYCLCVYLCFICYNREVFLELELTL